MKQKDTAPTCEQSRCRLINEICQVIHDANVPAEAREAGLTLIGWLARRYPEEPADVAGVRR